MAITIEAYQYNIIQSLYYFLNNETYTKNSLTKTLKSHFNDPQLDIILGYPQVLQELSLPTIALVMLPVAEINRTTYREQYNEIIYPFNLYGFCGGESSFERDQYQRDILSNDVRTLFEETEYINIYTVSNPPVAADFVTATTDVEIRNVRSRNLPPTSILVADRYRFLIEFEVAYVRSIATG